MNKEKTYTIRIRKANYIDEWAIKEEGSFEDSKRDPLHVYPLLTPGIKRLGDRAISSLIISGEYHCDAWKDDEIDGGAVTKRAIKNFVEKLKKLKDEKTAS